MNDENPEYELSIPYITGIKGEKSCPLPDEQGIREVQELYRETREIDLTDIEAREILFRVMRFIWIINMDVPPDSPLLIPVPDGEIAGS